MKKKYLYFILVAFFITAAGFVVLQFNNKKHAEKTVVYAFLNRNMNNNINEWMFAKKNAESLMTKLKANPGDIKSRLALTNAYITEGRISGNYAYYDRAAFKNVTLILEEQPQHYDALLLKSLLQLSQHHFAEGLATAQQALDINPNNAFVYGLLVDAHVEMGQYTAALDAADKMVSIRPDIRSYSRISYLREIYGDLNGAIDAMYLAVKAGVPGEENTEWCRVQLGRLYEKTGEVSMAEYQYNLSLAARPGYANALHGLGRIAYFRNKTDSALFYLKQASVLINDIDIKKDLAQAYLKVGDNKQAQDIYREVIAEMDRNATMIANDPEAGHYSDKEMAYFFAQHNNLNKALEHGLAEYNRRPLNNDVNELMAWIYYKRGEIDKAIPMISRAMHTNSSNPALLATAGFIYLKDGNEEKGIGLIKQAGSKNPVFPPMIAEEYQSVQQQIR